MPQLEQSSLQPSTDLQHRHLQTTSYNHLLLLHHLISRKGKHKQQQASPPPPPPPPPPPLAGGLRSQKGLRPFNPLQRIGSKHCFGGLQPISSENVVIVVEGPLEARIGELNIMKPKNSLVFKISCVCCPILRFGDLGSKQPKSTKRSRRKTIEIY